MIKTLVGRLARYDIEAVCGPLIGGAFVAQMVAAELDKQFFYAERHMSVQKDSLYATKYCIPDSLRQWASDKTFAIVDDAINAGSAVRATCADIEACGGTVDVVGALILCGEAILPFAAEQHVAVESIVQFANEIWLPETCPLCASGIPLEDNASSPQ